MLVLTLLVLAVLAALGAYVDRMVQKDVERAMLARQFLQNELDRHGTEVTLLYLIASGRTNHRALILEQEQRILDDPEGPPLPEEGDGEIVMSSVVYQGLGKTRFSLQDEWGLVPVNVPNSLALRALFQQVGLRPRDIDRLVPRIRDFIDTDSVLELNGAERPDYARRDMPPPADWYMASHLELKNVLGVDRYISPGQWRSMAHLLTARGVGVYNFNTMHPEVLASLFNIDGAELRAVLEARAERPLYRPGQIAMLTGRYLDVDDGSIVTYPSPYVRIATWPEDSAVASVAGYSMTPGGDMPWRTEYRYARFGVDHESETPGRAETPLFQQAGSHPDPAGLRETARRVIAPVLDRGPGAVHVPLRDVRQRAEGPAAGGAGVAASRLEPVR